MASFYPGSETLASLQTSDIGVLLDVDSPLGRTHIESTNSPSSTALPLMPNLQSSLGDTDLGSVGETSLPLKMSSHQFDPTALLNPRSLYKKPETASTEMAATNDSLVSHNMSTLQKPIPAMTWDFSATFSEHDELGQGQEMGLGTFIDNVHNVAHREIPPSKKVKREHESGQKATTFNHSKGGDVSEHVAEQRKLAQKSGASVVDLTEDDDVVFVSEAKDESAREVCYGRLDSTKIQAHMIPFYPAKQPPPLRNEWPSMKLTLQRYPGNNCIIMVRDGAGKDFGTVDSRTATALAPILDGKLFPNVRSQARLVARKRAPFELSGQAISGYLNMTINLYGPLRHVAAIGNFLTTKGISLMAASLVDVGVEVHNPHTGAKAVVPRRFAAGTSANYVNRSVEEIAHDVAGLFDSLAKSESLPEMEADGRVTTPLLAHQKQGLYFMTEREKDHNIHDEDEEATRSLWRLKYSSNGRRTYVHVITGAQQPSRPPDIHGGILGDQMGLGKTLLTLSLIVGSLADGEQWAEIATPATDDGEPLVRCLKTTLLIAPLSVMNNWEEQIKTHIQPNALKVYLYHGSNRIRDVDMLAEYDIVITTYHIVSSEAGGRSKKAGRSPLLSAKFFRIVLDEAHAIREQNTLQSQATCKLSAERRWALTGTPIQNKLDDLGALIKFLRVKPFDDNHSFASHILAPFKIADPEILPKLRILVDGITLRRLKDRIDLPSRHDHVIKLQFNREEQQLYTWFAQDAGNRMRAMIQGKKQGLGGKGYAHVLKAILRLRLISAHGRELLGEEDLKMTSGISSSDAIDLDDEDGDNATPPLTTRQVYEFLNLAQQTDANKCVNCNSKIAASENSEDPDESIGIMLNCYQMICNKCCPEFKQTVNQTTDDGQFLCPYCEQRLPLVFYEITPTGIEEYEEQQAEASKNPRQAKIMGRYQGPHTKTVALLASLTDSQYESKSLPPGEMPIKSVVFSGWTSHLDLIQIALEDQNIKFVRLDGKMSRKARNLSLERFRTEPEITVILVSIMAGGLGLNLTAASKVYVMEPQYNPAAEAQAVDRVHRLGQKREVSTYRFIMAGSVEENMRRLQRKKEDLADLSLNRNVKMDKTSILKDRLEELRSLFK